MPTVDKKVCLGCEWSWAERAKDETGEGHCFMFKEFYKDCKLNEAIRGRVHLNVYDEKGHHHYHKDWHIAVLKIEEGRDMIWIKCPTDGMIITKSRSIIEAVDYGTRIDYYPHGGMPEKLPLKLSGNMVTIDLKEAEREPNN